MPRRKGRQLVESDVWEFSPGWWMLVHALEHALFDGDLSQQQASNVMLTCSIEANLDLELRHILATAA